MPSYMTRRSADLLIEETERRYRNDPGRVDRMRAHYSEVFGDPRAYDNFIAHGMRSWDEGEVGEPTKSDRPALPERSLLVHRASPGLRSLLAARR